MIEDIFNDFDEKEEKEFPLHWQLETIEPPKQQKVTITEDKGEE